MPRPAKKTNTTSKATSVMSRETVLDKITGMYVLLKEVQLQQGHLQTSWDTWQESQRTNETKTNARIENLSRADQALTDAISTLSKTVTDVQIRIAKANITEKIEDYDKAVKDTQQKWTVVEDMKRGQDQIRVQLRIQWVFLFILAIVWAYVFGYYQSKGFKVS